MKVQVRIAEDYWRYDKESLVEMLQGQDREVERLRAELRLAQDEARQVEQLRAELKTAQEDCWKLKVRSEKLAESLRARDEKQKFYAVLRKAQGEGWLHLFVPNMTPKQRAWMEEWQKENVEKERAVASAKVEGVQRVRPGCYLIVRSVPKNGGGSGVF